MELGCDLSLLNNRLRKLPILFPEFEAWVGQRNISKFGMSRHPSGGYYPKSKATLVAMLTDPNNIGYRPIKGVIRRNRQGEKIIDHEPIIDRELFDTVYYSLARTDLDGNPTENDHTKRYFQRGSKADHGLLKFRIASHQGTAHTHTSTNIDKETAAPRGFYVIEYPEQEYGLFHRIYQAALPCDELDTIIVNRLMEHIREISHDQKDIAAYEEKAKKIRAERQRKIKQIEKSISDIATEQIRLTAQLGKRKQENGKWKVLSQRAQELILEQIDDLEEERQKLIAAKAELEEEIEGELGSLDEELAMLEASWSEHSFEKRRSLLNFLLKEVIVDSISTHWIRVEVLWLKEEWGREALHYWREQGGSKRWPEGDIAIMHEHYATMPKEQLMALLPERTWKSILWYGKQVLRIPRSNPRKFVKEFEMTASYSDLAFMRDRGMPLTARYTNWERLS